MITPISDAQLEHNPRAAYALFSGGDDSLGATHYTMENYSVNSVVHIRTGIGAKAATDFVVETCRLFGWPLRVMDPPDWSYRDMVLRRGFPGPGAHRYAYSWLKERAIAQLVRESKSQRKDRVMLVTGVRVKESARRMGYVEPVIRVGARVWVAPFFRHSKIDLHDYLKANNLKTNPLTALIGMSGECFCGAFAEPNEIKKIEKHCPEVAAQIHALEAEAEAAGKHHVWGIRPPKAKDPNQYDMPFMPLCAGCTYKPSYLQNG